MISRTIENKKNYIIFFFVFNKLYKKNKKNENNTFINHQNLVYLAIYGKN
jgi:hypothetical protein